MTSQQSLKSALDARVRTDQAERLASQRQNLGEGLMCPAGSGDIQNDVYGRPVHQNTLHVNDASCSNYTIFSSQRRINVENLERPYIPICASGIRGNSDFMGVGRDLLPQDLYGEGYRGNMIRHYNTPNNAPPVPKVHIPAPYYFKKIQPFSYSMDATTQTLFRG